MRQRKILGMEREERERPAMGRTHWPAPNKASQARKKAPHERTWHHVCPPLVLTAVKLSLFSVTLAFLSSLSRVPARARQNDAAK